MSFRYNKKKLNLSFLKFDEKDISFFNEDIQKKSVSFNEIQLSNQFLQKKTKLQFKNFQSSSVSRSFDVIFAFP